jgi:dihydropyrimidinase
VIWNPEKSITISAATQHQHVDYTPYEGMQIHGVPETVLLRGRVIVRDGEYTGPKGGGQYISRSTFSEQLS